MRNDKFPTLRDVVQIFNIDCRTDVREVNISCPVCAAQDLKYERIKKLHINFDFFDFDDGVFNCPRCGTSGRSLHLWALFKGLDPNDLKAAAKDYYSYSNKNRAQIKARPKRKNLPKEDLPIASIDVRDKTYNALLNMLTLSERHRNDLLKRGLTEDIIIENGYKTFPLSGHKSIAQFLLSSGNVLEGVPGFFTDKKEEWTLTNYKGGYLIPQRDGFGRIQGMQVRLDNPSENMPRYLTVSTVKMKNGTRGSAFCHFAKGCDISDVIITEGPLKADIISNFTGYSVIGIPGVNSVKPLISAIMDLKEAGMKKVTIAFDMDLYINPFVKTALERLKEILTSLSCPFTFLKWDNEQKGLDDWLLANSKE